jgi:hypothetical protein
MPKFLYQTSPTSVPIMISDKELSKVFGRPITWVDIPFVRTVPKPSKEEYTDFIIVNTGVREVGHVTIANRNFKKGEIVFEYTGKLTQTLTSPSAHSLEIIPNQYYIDGYTYLGYGSLAPALPGRTELEQDFGFEGGESLHSSQVATENVRPDVNHFPKVFQRGIVLELPMRAVCNIYKGDVIGWNYFHTSFFHRVIREEGQQPAIMYRNLRDCLDGQLILAKDKYRVKRPMLIVPVKEDPKLVQEGHFSFEQLNQMAPGEPVSFTVTKPQPMRISFPMSAIEFGGASDFFVVLKPVPRAAFDTQLITAGGDRKMRRLKNAPVVRDDVLKEATPLIANSSIMPAPTEQTTSSAPTVAQAVQTAQTSVAVSTSSSSANTLLTASVRALNQGPGLGFNSSSRTASPQYLLGQDPTAGWPTDDCITQEPTVDSTNLGMA